MNWLLRMGLLISKILQLKVLFRQSMISIKPLIKCQSPIFEIATHPNNLCLLDDLKIILYIVGAIAWLLYKNYQKATEQSKQRDFSKPFEDEVIEPEKKPIPIPVPPVVKSARPNPRPVRTKPAQSPRKPLRAAREQQPVNELLVEGGAVKPSESVRFDDPGSSEISWNNPIAEEIRGADFRKAFILSEVLQRPYN